MDHGQRLKTLFQATGVLTTRELVAAGFSRSKLSRLVAGAELTRLARGLYSLPDYQLGEHGALAIVAGRVPRVLFCLLSALRLHDLTTQAPFEVWIAIGNKAHTPKLEYPQLRVVRFSPEALTEAVEEHEIEGRIVRVTTVAKTVADCFKFRNQVGLDVAIEALRAARQAKRATADELWHCAQVDRVTNVMRPYLEAVE